MLQFPLIQDVVPFILKEIPVLNFHMDLSKPKRKKKALHVVPFFEKNGMKIIIVKSLTISPMMIMMTVLLFLALQ